jgi:hypothetical protein
MKRPKELELQSNVFPRLMNNIESFSSHELYFLLSQFAPVAALGWENPYTGWLAEEIEVVQKEALASLIDRDLIRMAGDNEIALDENIAKVFAACAHPDFSLLIAISKPGEAPAQTMVHSKDGLLVGHRVKKDKHTLRQFAGWDELLGELIPEVSPNNINTEHPASEFHITENTFAECEKLLAEQKNEQAEALLNAEIKDTQFARVLSEGLAEPLIRSAVIVLPGSQSNGGSAKSGLAVYQTTNHTWLLRPFERAGRQFIDFIPGNPQLIAQEFKQLLPISVA